MLCTEAGTLTAYSDWGRIDIVCPNAGIGDPGDFFDKVDANGDAIEVGLSASRQRGMLPVRLTTMLSPSQPEFKCLKITLIGQMYTVKLGMQTAASITS